MLKQIVLANNPLDPETWTNHEAENICEFLAKHFDKWPETARIYHSQVSVSNDVTPRTEKDIEELQKLEGKFYIIVYPAGPLTLLYFVAAALIVSVVILASQKVPNVSTRNIQSQSSNNELSERTNKPRINGRIPDIFGTVRSTPDLIALPYKIFKDNVEVECAYMCIGRGEYEVSEIKDDTTLVSSISGTSVEVYGPNTSPNSGVPQLSIGDAIETPVLNVARSNSVNGQVLRSPNDQTIVGENNIRFVAPNKIQLDPDSELDFTKEFESTDELIVENASLSSSYLTETKTVFANSAGYFKFVIPSSTLPPEYVVGKSIELSAALFNNADSDGFLITTFDISGIYEIESVSHTLDGSTHYANIYLVDPEVINPQWSNAVDTVTCTVVIKIADGAELFDLSGTYDITSVSEHEIVLDNPVSVNADWGTIATTEYISPTLSVTGDKWVGPFVLASKTMSQLFCNFVATNGLYKDDGKNQIAFDIELELEATPVDLNDDPLGDPEIFEFTLFGSSKLKSTIGDTLKALPTFTGRCQVRARRVTPSDKEFDGQIVDEVKWRDIYAVSEISQEDFGNVTTVQSVTKATNGALAIKERKLNMLVTRKIPARVSGSTFTTELYASNSADDIFSAICLDDRIGNRSVNEIDFNSIYDSVAEAKDYFGTSKAGEFNYTFDSDNLSFEETAKIIAEAVFCTAFRRGSIIKLNLEKETEDSTLLFNHSNKMPNSETRSVRFGNENKYDGVSFQYVDPSDDAIVTFYIPEDQTAINPKQVESLGIRHKLQAYFHANRTWNKIRYQNTFVEFEAGQEGNLLAPNDRILVSDNTRSETQDGQIEYQNGLNLTLSVPVEMESGIDYTMFIQYADGTSEGIEVQPGSTSRNVILSTAPRMALAVDDDFYAKATFILVGNYETGENAFLVSEKSSSGNMISKISAVNYDQRYYSNDSDYLNGVVDENGNEI